jgi:primosomal protein N' (replication factor Y)
MSSSGDRNAQVAQVILDSPLPQLDHAFDYAVPERLRADIRVGQKVSVPLRSGNRRSDAWVIALAESSAFTGNLADIDSIISPVAVLTPELYELARTVADRQAGSAVDVLRLAIPSRYVRVEKEFFSTGGEASSSSATPVPSLPECFKPLESLEPGAKASWLVQGSIVQLTSSVWVPEWVKQFVALAWQQQALGRSSILAVPDFRDVTLLEQALETAGLASFFVRTDAALPGAQRWKNYLRILTEECLIVIGNRSSVYAPVKNLGVIALWDSGDESFTEPLAPYAHPRDVALIRQSSTGCTLVFAAHVPSIDTIRLESLDYLTKETRGSDPIKIVATDLHTQADENQRTSRIPPSALVSARAAIALGPVLIQVARPGFAGTLKCSSCRTKAVCTACQGPLRLKTKGAIPSCRWCGRLEPAWSCFSCHSSALIPAQAGSEKTAEDLARAFPGVVVHFSDGEKKTSQVPSSPSLVIATAGTEPVAQNGYAAVLILDGEAARSREDLETDSTALRIWMNAASLARPQAPVFVAGSGTVLGEVLEGHSLRQFAERTLKERESLGLPPATRVAVITGSRGAIEQVEQELPNIPHRSILGPVPLGEDLYRIIVAFDYKDGAAVAKSLRAMILKTAVTNRKPSGAGNSRARVLRLNVRIDDFALRGIG